MIDLKTLTEILENKLNNKAEDLGYSQYHFYIHTDTGDFKKPERQYNTTTEYINGIMQELSSDLNNLAFDVKEQDTRTRFGVINCSTQLLVPLPNYKDDKEHNGVIFDGQKSVIAKVRKIIDDVAENTSLETIEVGGMKFKVSTTISFANTGLRDMVEEVGDSITYAIYITYLFTQNGVNAREMIYYIDGKVIPYEGFTESRVINADNNVYADTKQSETEARQLQSVWNVVFELPITEAFTPYLRFICNGGINVAHILETPSLYGRERFKMVFIDNMAVNGQGLANVGSKLTFIKARADYYSITLSDSLKAYRALEYIGFNEEAGVAYNFTKGVFVVNGDFVNENDIITTTANLSTDDYIKL